MHLKIANDIRVENPNETIKRYCDTKLTLDNPDYLTAKRVGRYTGNIEKQIKLYIKNANSLIIPYGCLKDVWSLSKGASYECNFHSFLGNKMEGSINLYDYQKVALFALKEGKNGILEAPCGSGKTNMGLQLIKEIGGKALWLTHTGKLLEQSRTRCETFFKGDFGEITKGKIQIGRDITFATVQTMSKIDVEVYKNEFDIVIVDECHHCVGSPTKVMQFYKVITNCNSRYKFGLSATLNRADNMISSMFSLIGNVLHTIKQSEVGDKIITAEHRKVEINLDYKMNDYLDYDGTLNYMKLIDTLSNSDERNEIIINNVYDNYAIGKKQIILCHRVKQVEELSKRISKFCLVNCLTGKTSLKKRNFDGDVIIATYSLAKEGLDAPFLDVLHLATPQKNASTTEQSVGRIERNIDGKEQPICFDYVDVNIDYCNLCYKRRKSILLKKSKKK